MKVRDFTYLRPIYINTDDITVPALVANVYIR
jgi:hypothetical protein